MIIISDIIKKWFCGCADLLYPRCCPVCDQIVLPKGELICPGCVKQLSPVKNPACKRCGKEIISAQEEYCPDCVWHTRTFDSGMALLNYNKAARHSMAQIKYKNKREYLDFYAQAIWRRFEKQIRYIGADALVPVPVHSSRRRQRGFNQALELANRLEKLSKIPSRPEWLVRTKKTNPQKNLTPSERFANLRQAFEAGSVPGSVRCVILVDDIYTTGSTAEACARVLKQAGVETVHVLSICIGQGRE